MTGRTLTFVIFTAIACCLIGCFSKAVPDWQHSGFNNLEQFKHAFLSGGECVKTVNLSAYEKGIYIVRFSNKNFIQTAKLLIN